MLNRQAWLLPSLLLFLAGASPAAEPLRVLFVGNSYTAANNLPAMVAAMAEESGGRPIHVVRHTFGGCTFERHVNETGALEKIAGGDWHGVVLQEQSTRPVLERDLMVPYARVLHEAIDKRGARTVFYLTWARQHIPEMQSGPAEEQSFDDYAQRVFQLAGEPKGVDFDGWLGPHEPWLRSGLSGAYLGLAEELHAEVAPVGIAWQRALAADPNLGLHRGDKSHPTPAGTYLAACVFYATLLEKSPVGLPATLKQNGRVLAELDPAEAQKLQEIAWQTVHLLQSPDTSLP